MKAISFFVVTWLLAASIILPSVSVRAQTLGQLKIYHAIEVEFGTETGKLYQLEGSSNLVDWSATDQLQCGTGLPVTRLFAARALGNSASKFYRLQIIETNCNTLLPRGLLLLGAVEHLTVAANLLGVGGLNPRQNTIPNANEAVLFTVSLADGPMPQTLDQIIAIQGKQHGPAAIFLVNGYLADDPELRELVLLETKDLLKKYQQPGVDAMPVFYDDHPTILEQIRDLIAHGTPP
jgi:hypothetical protein